MCGSSRGSQTAAERYWANRPEAKKVNTVQRGVYCCSASGITDTLPDTDAQIPKQWLVLVSTCTPAPELALTWDTSKCLWLVWAAKAARVMGFTESL